MSFSKGRTNEFVMEPELNFMEPQVKIGPHTHLMILKPSSIHEDYTIILPKIIEPTKPQPQTNKPEKIMKKHKTKKDDNRMSVIYYKVSPNRETKLFPYKKDENITHYGHWSPEEHQKFIEGYERHGRKWAIIAEKYVKTRTTSQVTSHAQQYFRNVKFNQ